MIKRGFSPAVRFGLACLHVFVTNFKKETISMNLCNRKLSSYTRTSPYPEAEVSEIQVGVLEGKVPTFSGPFKIKKGSLTVSNSILNLNKSEYIQLLVII